MSKALENAKSTQFARGNHPSHTRSTWEEREERSPYILTGLRYRDRLNKILKGECPQFCNKEIK